MNTEIHQELMAIAFKRSIPFCYGCYQDALHEVGEYGADWIILPILESDLRR